MHQQPSQKIIQVIRWTIIGMLATSAIILTMMITMRQQRLDDIHTIRSAGGVIHTRSELPDTLKDNLGNLYPEWFETPYAVWLPASYTDTNLTLLARFEDLSSISLEGTSITDDGTKGLVKFRNLRLLTIPQGVSKQTEKYMRNELPQLVTAR